MHAIFGMNTNDESKLSRKSKDPDSFDVGVKAPLHLQVPQIKFEKVAEYRHDNEARTQGLVFFRGDLYESTGGDKDSPPLSSLRQVELKTGRPLKIRPVNEDYFAEGLAIFQERVFQLTEDSGVGLIYDVTDLEKPAVAFEYKGWTKGWGLTHDGKCLIMSDGSDQLRLINPETTELIGDPISVSANGNPCSGLNELESVGSHIYANVIYTDVIVKIDRNDGNVIGQIDLSALRPTETRRCVDCGANGIAFDKASNHFFITGKLWPALFRIRLFS